ncbi:hypothetical protein DNU06_07585 [Putridiphycobacter roseus]|uniref:Deoxyribose-phosphate aldolase n=1 Tax=Putridiphycobacter roseus TaxID=2219161 RepID=A0A2W1NQ39_9FLAO|nr:hypothetical protein DNU06_07585 [Putridiphycobacter roseus]
MKLIFASFLLISITVSCSNEKAGNPESAKQQSSIEIAKIKSTGDSIVAQSILAHGGDLYASANYQFTFRNKIYTFKNSPNHFAYSRLDKTDSLKIFDKMDNDSFERIVNETTIDLSEEEQSKYRESINSVVYFATLPYKLNDAAVFKKWIGTTTIKDTVYNVIEVSFSEEGGGEDHDDLFYYWFNVNTNTLDYLAYQYATNGGGVRFRAAYNRSVVDGIVFQDYINYEVAVGTALSEIPALYMQDSLKELSRIKTEAVKSLK